MTTEEKLNAIMAKCRAFLELAEKRTPGEWRKSEFGPISTAKGNVRYIAQVSPHGRGDSLDDEDSANAAFIASCAGLSEAAARSTIAAIEGILPYLTEADAASGASTPGHKWELNLRAKEILDAWPNELLTGGTR